MELETQKALGRIRAKLVGLKNPNRGSETRASDSPACPERASASRRVPRLPVSARPSLSICLIVKDEAEVIGRCLDSVRGLAGEIVVADTGSADATPEIAARAGARVIRVPWTDDFSAARNAVLDAAAGDWVLILDADEALSPADHDTLREETARAEAVAYRMLTRNYSRDAREAEWAPADPREAGTAGSAGWTPSRKVRLFRRDPRVRFHGRVHEKVEPSLERLGAAIRDSDVPVHHYGYLREAGRLQAKSAYYRTLGAAKAGAEDGSARALYELGVEQLTAGRPAEALATLTRAEAAAPVTAPVLLMRGMALNALGRPAEAEAAFTSAILKDPSCRDAHLNRALLRAASGRTAEAEADLADLARRDPACWLAHHNLGSLRFRRGDLLGARESFEEAIRIHPAAGAAYEGLVQVNQRSGRADRTPALLAAARRSGVSGDAMNRLEAVARESLGL